MGWTSYHATYYAKNGNIDRKAECDAYFMEGLNRGHYRVEKSTLVGSVYYAAVRILKRVAKDDSGQYIRLADNQYLYEDIPVEEQKVFGTVFLTSVNNNDYYNFSYKDMDESMGPCYYDCPESILKLLSPTDSEYALNWRASCREQTSAKKRLNAAPIGTAIHFFLSGKEVQLVKRAPSYQFKKPWWYNPANNTYMRQSQIPLNFTVQNEQ